MPATKTEGFLLPPIEPNAFYLAIKAGLTALNLGNPIVEDNNHLVYAVSSGTPNKVYSTWYFEVWVDDLVIGQRLHSTFDEVSGTGSNTDTSNVSPPVSDSASLQWVALDGGSEFKLLLLYQDEFSEWVRCAGFIKPAGKPHYWDENALPYGFGCRLDYNPFERWTTTDINPYDGDDITTTFYGYVPSLPNPFDNQSVDVVTKVLFIPGNSRGIAGLSSADLGQATNEALDSRSLVLVDNQQYMVIVPGRGYASPVVRVANGI